MKSITYFLFLFTSLSIAQSSVKAFQAGEKLTYTASYKMSGLMTELAEINMQATEVKTKKNTLLKLKCTAKTFSKWDNFFKIRDLYESYVNPRTLTPYLYQRDINEGNYFKFVKYIFNHKTKTVKTLITKRAKVGGTYDQKKNVTLNPGTKDLVTTIYHIRNLDIHKAKIGDRDSFTILFDLEESKITLTYIGKESIKTNLGYKECYKLAISINKNDVLKGTNDNILWLTADENKIPVYAKFKVAIGSGELKIKTATGLKY